MLRFRAPRQLCRTKGVSDLVATLLIGKKKNKDTTILSRFTTNATATANHSNVVDEAVVVENSSVVRRCPLPVPPLCSSMPGTELQRGRGL